VAGTPAPTLKVASRAVSVDAGTGSVPVRLTFATPANYPAGTPVQIEIDAETRTGVVIVPVAAVVHEGEEAAVFVVAGEMAKRRVVMIGLQSGDRVEIRDGVKAGEMVVVSGQNGLPDGARVTVAKPEAGTPADGGTSEK
jgi:hypothetical protein